MCSKKTAGAGGAAIGSSNVGKWTVSRLLLCTLLTLLVFSSVEPARVEAEVPGAVDGLEGAAAVTVSPDGAHVYVASSAADAVAVFSCDGGSLTFVEAYFNAVGDVTGLDGAQAVTVSPDGGHVYVVGRQSDAVAVFNRNGGTGELSFVEAQVDGVDGVHGVGVPNSVAVSPDGAHVYVTGARDDAVAVFSRDAGTGALTFVEAQIDGVGGVEGLGGVATVTVSPDGWHVYVTGLWDDAVAVFSRDVGTGALTFVEAQIDGVGGVDGLDGPRAATVSHDGKHLYALGQYEDAVAVFDRDGVTGRLTFVEAQFDGTGGVEGLRGGFSLTVSPDGLHLYVASEEGAVAVFGRDVTTGELTFVEAQFDDVGGVDGLADARSVAVSPDGGHLYVAGHDDDAVALFSRDAGTGQLTFEDVWMGHIQRIKANRLVIWNAVPDNKEKNRALWVDRGKGYYAFGLFPDPDTDDDPRCNGDPAGTVKASIRFFSLSSGQDTAPIDLPCQNWRASIKEAPGFVTYKYLDRELDEGPCKRVLLKDRRSVPSGTRTLIKAKCTGKGAVTDFLYDLTKDTSESPVYVVLRTGRIKFCSRFFCSPGSRCKDGSDGRTFASQPKYGYSVPNCPAP